MLVIMKGVEVLIDSLTLFLMKSFWQRQGDKMNKLFKVVLIALIFSAVIFTGCNKKNKAPEKPSIPAGPTSGSIDTLYTFTSSAEDPDEDSIAIRFIWGDEDTSNWSDFVSSGDSVSMFYSWSDTGTYSIKAQAQDLNEAVSSWSDGHNIIISLALPTNNPPNTPITPIGVSTGSINFSYSFISTATDPDGDSIAIKFDWGDGNISDWSDWKASGDSITMTHSWSDAGTYIIKAQAKDKNNATSNWSSGHWIEISAGWTKTFGGSAGDYGRSVQQTLDGGYIITGYTSSYGVGGQDVYLIKTNANGDTLWTKTFGGTSEDRGYSVQQTSDGGYIIVGSTYSFGGQGQVYLVKTDANGNEQWHKTKGFSDCDDWGNSVQQTSDGGYIIVGRTHDAGTEAIYLIKTDANGNNQWYHIKGYDHYDDVGNDVQQTSDGGYIIVGYTEGYGNGDVFLIRTDASGGGGWNNHFGGSSSDVGYSVQQTTDGGYIITGNIGNDIYLIKTDTSGNQTWYKTFGGTDYDWGYSVQQTTDGGYIITGETKSYGAGNVDVYLIKTDASGNETWSNTFGGTSNDMGRSVQQITDGGYIITGYTASYGAGSFDVYLIKTDEDGNVK
jgi:hypothetical protein